MSRIDKLSADDLALIAKVLDAAANGPFFPDWEFGTLFGMSRTQFRSIAEGWPANETLPSTAAAVKNALNNLAGYPHGKEQLLEATVSTPMRLNQLLSKLRLMG